MQSRAEKEFADQIGDVVYNQPYEAIADEIPGAYKDVDSVIETLVDVGIARKVVQLMPLAVIKGD